MRQNLNNRILVKSIFLSGLIVTNLYAMEAPLKEQYLKVIVSTLNKANVPLLLDPNANSSDLKEKVSLYDSIDTKDCRVYLIKSSWFGIFQRKTNPIDGIQKLKDVIDFYKTNQFLIAP